MWRNQWSERKMKKQNEFVTKALAGKFKEILDGNLLPPELRDELLAKGDIWFVTQEELEENGTLFIDHEGWHWNIAAEMRIREYAKSLSGE